MSNLLEPLDIVDTGNTVLYSTTKKEAHEKGLLHRTVIGQVINSCGDHILVKQTPDRQDAGQFVAPVGGHVRAGESEDEALKREAEEEIGLKDFKFKFIGRVIFNREVIGRKENHLFVLYEIYTDDDLILGTEAEEYKAFPIAELKKILKENPALIGNAHHFVIQHFYPELLSL